MRHVSGWEIAALIVCVILFIGCQPAAEPSGTDATNTTPDPVAQNESVQEEDKPTTIVIDVRSKEEWDTGHVGQAIHIPHTEIASRIEEHVTDKAANIVLYCRSGGRAGTAKAELEKLGYTNVENVGGYEEIKDQYAQ